MENNRREQNRICILEHPEYECMPVGVREFILSREYLNLARRCWPSVLEDLDRYYSGDFCETVFVQGIGSGKGFRASIIMAYEVYKLLCLRNPQEYFGLSNDSSIFIVNVSVNAEQSERVVFHEFRALIMHSLWFKKHYRPNTKVKGQLLFPKNIAVFSGNSSETKFLGYNVFAAIMDEAAFYISTPGHDVAEEIHDSLKARIVSRFGSHGGPMVIISSPKYEDDFIERKMREARHNKRILGVRRTLWEAKPMGTYTKGWIDFLGYRIPKELEEEAHRNPEKFKRDYMAIPSGVIEPYFTQQHLIDEVTDPAMQSPLDVNGGFKPWFVGQGHGYYIHVDLSLRRDATGMAMVHEEDGIIWVDLMMQIKAPPGGEIIYSKIRDIIFDIQKRHFDIRIVTFDGWQSQDSIQILKDRGIKAEVLSVDRDTKAYDTLKDRIYDKKFRKYPYEVVDKELKRLEFINGEKINHPPYGSKDVADALAGAVFMCVSNPNRFWFPGIEKIIAQRKALRARGINPDSLMGRGTPPNKDGLVHYGECDGRYFPPDPVNWM